MATRTSLNLPDPTEHFTSDEMFAFQRELIALRAEYGRNPQTREQTIAHEAGRSIVTVALGWRFDSSRVTRDGDVWVGETHWHHRLSSKSFRKADEPRCLFQMAIQHLAGRCGQIDAGLFHEASAVNERCSAAFLCRDIDAIAGWPGGTAYKRAEAIARRSIAVNAKLFDEFRALLEQKRHVRAREGRKLLEEVVRIGDWATWIKPVPDLLTAATTSGRSRRGE